MKISWTKRQHKFSRFYWRYHGRDSSWIMHMFFDWLGVACFLRRHSNQVLLDNNNNNNNKPLNHLNHLTTLLIKLHEFFTADLLLHSQLGGGMRWDEKKRLWVQDSAAVGSKKKNNVPIQNKSHQTEVNPRPTLMICLWPFLFASKPINSVCLPNRTL